MVFTDPPYNLSFSGTEGNFDDMKNDTLTQDAYDRLIKKASDNLILFSKDTASSYICIDYRKYHKWVNYFEKTKLELINCIVWDKVFAGLGYKYRFRHEFIMFYGIRDRLKWYGDFEQEDFIKLDRIKDNRENRLIDLKGYSIPISNDQFLRLKTEDSNPKRVPVLEGKSFKFRTNSSSNTDIFEGFSMNYFSQREQEFSEGIVHPTMKPLRLISKAIKNSSMRGDMVLDLFGGSGSTLIACEKTDRICYMMELSEDYISVILDRWEKLTGKQAIRIVEGGKPQ